MSVKNVLLYPDANIRSFIKRYKLQNVKNVFELSAHGFSGEFTEQELFRLERDPMVKIIEDDTDGQETVDSAAKVTAPGWALDHISEPSFPFSSGLHEYSRDGSGVHVYVVDNGAQLDHVEFSETKTVRGYRSGNEYRSDHATAVMSCVGGRIAGTAKRATLVDVVRGEGASEVAMAFDWIIKHHLEHGGPSVAVISTRWIGGNITVDEASLGLIQSGVLLVTSAGNENAESSLDSPARVSEVLTVGGTNSDGAKAANSSWGSNVDVWAPYDDVLVARDVLNTLFPTWDNDQYRTTNGTSYSAPYVAGVCAILLQYEPTLTPAQLHQKVIDLSYKDLITGLGATDNNRFIALDNTMLTTGTLDSADSNEAVVYYGVNPPPPAGTAYVEVLIDYMITLYGTVDVDDTWYCDLSTTSIRTGFHDITVTFYNEEGIPSAPVSGTFWNSPDRTYVASLDVTGHFIPADIVSY